MNIKQAKEEIKHTVQAYLSKDAFGEYKIPAVRQRPVLLIGPPGIGKTQIMEQISRECKVGLVSYTITHHTRQSAIGLPFISRKNFDGKEMAVTEYTMSEIVASIYEKIQESGLREGILFIDEIHRFSKSQQDSLLGAVEKGIVTLIGATTENPSFEVIRPLLSRCQLYVLKPLEKEDLEGLLQRAVTEDVELKQKKIELKETAAMLRFSGGDARKLLNILELVVESAGSDEVVITDKMVEEQLQQNPLAYDKQGEMHYDIISAFIKSIRGSDPDAALYWMARMIEGGEDPQFIARRVVISASEDVGLANPNALLLANAAFDTVMKIGWPEARIALAEAVVYLATSPKSNSAYLGINDAIATVKQTGNLPVPLHIRNAPTKLMKDLGYHDGYKYPHDYPGHFTEQQYLPDELKDARFWQPQHSPSEERLYNWMVTCWGERFKN